jgi:hypothetical protein
MARPIATPLPLAAGKLPRIAVQQLGDAQHGGGVVHPFFNLRLGNFRAFRPKPMFLATFMCG